jgi:hypothetical protein
VYKKLFFVFILLLLPIHAIAQNIKVKSSEKPPIMVTDDESGIKYSSAQYTNPEKIESKPIVMNSTLAGYEKAAENDNLILYVNKKSLALKIKDKKTNFIWDSGPGEQNHDGLNKTWQQMAQSAITIEYSDRLGKVRSESILTNHSHPDVKLIKCGFSASVDMNQANIHIQMDVGLKGNALTVSIPQKEIQENGYTKLISMKVYPFLGAVNQQDVDGYMFIPDGSGALIRYGNSGKGADAPFTGSIYGNDQGFQRTVTSDPEINSVQQIKMPVFGVVHGVKQNGFITVIQDGAPYADINAYPAGVSTRFNWVSTLFHYRYQYFQPTNKNMDGINVYQKSMNHFNIKLRYMFLENNQADYVGMAKQYQNYLVATGQLTKHKDNADIRLEFLGGEAKQGLIWNTVLPMTKVASIPNDLNELKENNVDHMFVIYKGWSKGGLTGTLPAKFPFESKLGSMDELQSVITSLKKENVPIYFYTDYTKAFEGATGYSGSRDVAKKISSETISTMENNKNIYYLSPWKSLELAKEDITDYKKYGMSNLAVDSSGYTLFSDFSSTQSSNRIDTIKTYNKVFSELNKHVGQIALYEPSVYAWKSSSRYLDIPMYSSNYLYETDTVPFLQIVLKGYIPYYAPFSNFYSDSQDQVLRMVEYGAYPSFLLTDQPADLLAKTASKDVYTSEFKVWKDEIIKQYQTIQQTLGQVKGASIEGREIPMPGIVEVSYSNGKTIIVNYTDSSYSSHGIHVEAKGFAVVNGGGEK